MKDFARRKQYVEVVATHYIDGSVRPQKIVLATGPVYEIEDMLAPGDRDHILSGVFNQFLSALTEPVE